MTLSKTKIQKMYYYLHVYKLTVNQVQTHQSN